MCDTSVQEEPDEDQGEQKDIPQNLDNYQHDWYHSQYDEAARSDQQHYDWKTNARPGARTYTIPVVCSLLASSVESCPALADGRSLPPIGTVRSHRYTRMSYEMARESSTDSRRTFADSL